MTARFLTYLFLVGLFISPVLPYQQTHVVFGDFRVQNADGTPNYRTFQVTLWDSYGKNFGRLTLSDGGRFRFISVPNGEYRLSVLIENSEVAKIAFFISQTRSTDVRKDIQLQWSSKLDSSLRTKEETTQASQIVYARSKTNQELFERAQQGLSKNQLGGAQKLLKQIVKGDETDFEVWNELGTALFLDKQFKEGEKAYLKSLQLQPDHLLAKLNLSKLRLEREDYFGAIEVLEEATSANPRSPESHFFLGVAYLMIQKGSTAVGHLNEALRLDPMGMAEAHLRLGGLYDAAGMQEKAALEYEKFLQKRPEYPQRREMQTYVKQYKDQ